MKIFEKKVLFIFPYVIVKQINLALKISVNQTLIKFSKHASKLSIENIN